MSSEHGRIRSPDPTVTALVSDTLAAVELDAVLAALEAVSAHDRYQASAGIERAAILVAARAADAGLTDVEVRHHRADGAVRWWSFAAPTSWTPTTARLWVPDGSGQPGLSVDHAVDPFALATHSAAASTGPVPLVPVDGDVRGAIVALDADRFTVGALVHLERAGASGFVTDAPAQRTNGARGRIELPAGTGLFGFSLTQEEFARARRASCAGAVVELGPPASMPVVTGVLPGAGAGEVWLTAHLCHPRPGADDNASGVAALLGVAAALTALRRHRRLPVPPRSVRFLWGPEFTGTVATLHRRMCGGERAELPVAVVNLDMVGADQDRCGARFVVERPPDCVSTPETAPVAALAELIVDEVFAQTADGRAGWRAEPFTGFSDHALFADPAVGRPAVQFCHPEDRFNHSAADSTDKISPLEMLRSTAAATVLAQVVADHGADVDVARVVRQWCDVRAEAVERAAHSYRDVENGAWSSRLRVHAVDWRARVLGGRGAGRRRARTTRRPGPVRRWDGPLNVRAMLAAAAPASRDAVGELVAADKANLSLVFNLGIRMTGESSCAELVDDVSFARLRPVDPHAAQLVLGAYADSGWAG